MPRVCVDGQKQDRQKRDVHGGHVEHPTHDPKCKIGQHFVWVMVVRCGERSPHKPPVKGGEPTMRKGSYSEELVKHQEVSHREREQQSTFSSSSAVRSKLSA